MTTPITDLIESLQQDVPANHGVPSTEQYQRAVKDAVLDFSRKVGREKVATLSIVKGTATYDLPVDFMKLIKLDSLTDPSGIIVSGQGLIPVPATWSEEYTITGGKITFYPMPAYTLARSMRYKAGWVLNEANAYEDMGEEEASIILLKAQALCMSKQANAQSGKGWRYSFGAESVDKSGLSESIRNDAEAKEDEYLAAVKNYIGMTFIAE